MDDFRLYNCAFINSVSRNTAVIQINNVLKDAYVYEMRHAMETV